MQQAEVALMLDQDDFGFPETPDELEISFESLERHVETVLQTMDFTPELFNKKRKHGNETYLEALNELRLKFCYAGYLYSQSME